MLHSQACSMASRVAEINRKKAPIHKLIARVQRTRHNLETPAFVRMVLDCLVDNLWPGFTSGLGLGPDRHAITVDEIQNWIHAAHRTYLSDRTIKAAIKWIVEEAEIPIGSARGKGAGYFFIVSQDQARLAIGPLVAEIKSLARRCRIFGPRNQLLKELSGQAVIQ